MLQGIGPGDSSTSRSDLEGIKSTYGKKSELIFSEFFNFIVRYAESAKSPTISNDQEKRNLDLISMARKTIKRDFSAQLIPQDKQRSIARAILQGTFGDSIPEAAAEKIAENLGVFMEPIAQRDIVEAIVGGKFGDPIPEAVAEKIAKNLYVFMNFEAQKLKFRRC